MGFTVVDVNMRGTGCSGGAFDFFEPLQNLDGYDVIETIAHQPWVANHKVGMMGISYGGISQLFTAADPAAEPGRDRAAVGDRPDPDDALSGRHPQHRLRGRLGEGARPRRRAGVPTGGQAWAYQQIQEGDTTCAANQALHREAVNLLTKIHANNHYVPAVADPLSPITFVNKINVPIFMACQWTDEQTGGHCPDLAEHFTGTQRKWFTFTNGTHIDSLDPETFNRWYDFLQLYVAQQPPARRLRGRRAAAAPLVYQEAIGITGVTLPPDPIQQQPTYDAALAAFEALPPIRVLFDNGAGERRTRATRARALSTRSRASRSPARRRATGTSRRTERWRRASPPAPVTRRFTWNAHARPLTDFTGDTAAGSERPLDGDCRPTTGSRRRRAARSAYLTGPLTANTTVIGAGAVHVWVKLLDAERRPAGDDHRGPRPTARRPSSRTAGSAPTSASSTGARARCSSRSSACAHPTSRRSRASASSR